MISSLCKKAEKYFTALNSEEANYNDANECPINENEDLVDESMINLFYKTLRSTRSQKDIKYLDFSTNGIFKQTKDFPSSIKCPRDNSLRKKTKTSTISQPDDATLDERLLDMINEEKASKNIASQKIADSKREEETLADEAKRISTTGLMEMYEYGSKAAKRQLFLDMVERYNPTTLVMNEKDENQITNSAAFNSLITDFFTSTGGLYSYFTYFQSLLTPNSFAVPLTCKLTTRIPFANYALNFIRHHLGEYNSDAYVNANHRLPAEHQMETEDEYQQQQRETITFKSLIMLCQSGKVFKNYELIKDVNEQKLLDTYSITGIEDEVTASNMSIFMKHILQCSYYALLLTLVNEYRKSTVDLKDISGELPVHETLRYRCSLVVHMLNNLPDKMFLKDAHDKKCIWFNTSDIYYDHVTNHWFWYDGRNIVTSTNIITIIIKMLDALLQK